MDIPVAMGHAWHTSGGACQPQVFCLENHHVFLLAPQNKTEPLEEENVCEFKNSSIL